MRKRLIVFTIVVTMVTMILFPINTNLSTPSLKLQHFELTYTANPIKAVGLGSSQGQYASGSVPFNLDMVDVKGLSKDGDGIYVAVLDTGLLTDYLNFFPEHMVDIKEEWGIGFTHDVFYVGTGGNWSADGQFSYGPLKEDRGFITYDHGNPLPVEYPDGSIWYYPFGNGHGSHVTSIITGWQLDRSDGYSFIQGVAPKVTIIPVLVLDDWIEFNPSWNGYWWSGGTDEMVAAGIRYIGDLAHEHGIKIVINMSLGGPTPADEIEEAIDYAIEQGVIVVASAGNSGYAGMGWPGAFPQVISTAAAGWTQEYYRYWSDEINPWYWWTDNVKENMWGSVDPLGNDFHAYLTDFSSRPNPALGQETWHLDVSAPGAGVKGPYKPSGGTQWGYYSVWGTSQASPHVAGIAALLLEKYPDLSQSEMEACLKAAGEFNPLTARGEDYRTATVFDIFSGYPIQYEWYASDYGTGLLQADEAFYVAKSMF